MKKILVRLLPALLAAGAIVVAFSVYDGKRFEGEEQFEAKLKVAQGFSEKGSHADARRILEDVVQTMALPPEKWTQARLLTAKTHIVTGDDFTASKIAEDTLANAGGTPSQRIEALFIVVKAFSQFGNTAGWTKVRDLSQEILEIPEASSVDRTNALRSSVRAYLALRQYAEAAEAQQILGSSTEVSEWERTEHLAGLARTRYLQSRFEESRELVQKVEGALQTQLGTSVEKTRVQDLLADVALIRALSYYEQKDLVSARLELEKIPKMPGQTAASRPTREAVLRMNLQKWITPSDPVLKVLFVGSSHTLLGNLPLLVEQISASAPAGSVRIVAGEQARTGTGMRGHWADGEGFDTARGKISTEPWDVVVVETFYRLTRDEMRQYGGLYAGIVRDRGAKLLIYETPVAKDMVYPRDFLSFHESNMWLGNELKSDIAPSVTAWMKVLGATPTGDAFEQLYVDRMHATGKGAYLTACTLYSALTGHSPVGLYAPKELPSGEAREYQEAAWHAYQETKLKMAPGSPEPQR